MMLSSQTKSPCKQLLRLVGVQSDETGAYRPTISSRDDESAGFCPTSIDISPDQLLPCPSFLPPLLTHSL